MTLPEKYLSVSRRFFSLCTEWCYCFLCFICCTLIFFASHSSNVIYIAFSLYDRAKFNAIGFNDKLFDNITKLATFSKWKVKVVAVRLNVGANVQVNSKLPAIKTNARKIAFQPWRRKRAWEIEIAAEEMIVKWGKSFFSVLRLKCRGIGKKGSSKLFKYVRSPVLYS